MSRLNQYFFVIWQPIHMQSRKISFSFTFFAYCQSSVTLYIKWLEVMPKVKPTNSYKFTMEKLTKAPDDEYKLLHVRHTQTHAHAHKHIILPMNHLIYYEMARKRQKFFFELFMLILFYVEGT